MLANEGASLYSLCGIYASILATSQRAMPVRIGVEVQEMLR
jgi:hypothetical protein